VLALPAARERLAARRGWIAWGLAWFALATATLAPIHPLWQPNRSHFGATGAGVAAAVALEAVHPLAPVALLAGRLALLALAPPPARTISEEAPETGAFMDFAQLSRLQKFMAETRGALTRHYPEAPPHSNLITMNLPRGLTYALGGDRAGQVWYRDTTLRTLNFKRLAEDSTLRMLAGVQFQLRSPTQIVLLSPEAMREQDRGYRRLRERHWAAALTALQRADSLEPDGTHEVFHGNNAGYRSLAWVQLGRIAEAEREARRAIALDERDKNGGRVLVSVLLMQERIPEAAAALARVERQYANEPWVAQLRANLDDVRQEVARRASTTAPRNP
jgi:tetratricopeptide (TPR) repeat protein